jgi:hypothetical protein
MGSDTTGQTRRFQPAISAQFWTGVDTVELVLRRSPRGQKSSQPVHCHLWADSPKVDVATT